MKFPAYEFHEIVSDEPMMSDEEQAAVIADMAEFGYDSRYPIYLYEGKIAIGRNRYVCAKKAGVIPVFKPIAAKVDIEALLHRDTYLRKHYAAELLQRKRAARIERIAILRENGASQRDIAEREKISRAQVVKDIEAAELDTGCPVVPLNGKVTGHDGKSREAAPIRKVMCERCKRVGATAGCQACSEAKKAARKPTQIEKSVTEIEPEEPPTIEEQIKAVNAELESWCRGLMKYLETLPSDPWVEQQQIESIVTAKLKNACEAVRACKCSHLCPKCNGSGCVHCKKTGRVPSVIFNSLGGVS